MARRRKRIAADTVDLTKRAIYALNDFEAWADQGTKLSTTDPDGGWVRAARRYEPEPLAQLA